MFPERDISTSFKASVRLMSVAAVGLMIACVSAAVLMASADYSPWVFSAGLVLAASLLALAGLLVLAHVRFQASRNDLGSLLRQRFHAMSFDTGTGALLRAPFLDAFTSTLHATPERRVGYIHIDMDDFKTINDSHGHRCGDAALRHLADVVRLKAPQARLGRLGGDEFGLFLPAPAGRAPVMALAQSILGALREPVTLEGVTLCLCATLGVAVSPADGDSVEALMAHSDLALYAGKAAGRCQVVAYEAEMSQDERASRFIERELRSAILLNQLDVHYQPIVRITGEDIGQFEALVRWNHPYRGRISPGDFIAVAERSALIDSLGEWVLRRVCAQRATLGARVVSVNVSVVQLRRNGFAERFLGILTQSGTPFEAIIVEITETVRLRADAVELRNLEQLIKAGVRISIDDFGSGATSLDYLRRLDFHAVKIDRSYTANLEHDPVSRALVGGIANIGQALGINVVAEGVETEAQMRLLQAAGCTHLQGYYFGAPRCADAPPETGGVRRVAA